MEIQFRIQSNVHLITNPYQRDMSYKNITLRGTDVDGEIFRGRIPGEVLSDCSQLPFETICGHTFHSFDTKYNVFGLTLLFIIRIIPQESWFPPQSTVPAAMEDW